MRLPENLEERELYVLERAQDLTFDWFKVTTPELSFWTSGDALKLDAVRVPVSARLAQAVCDLRGFVLPTPKMVDLAHAAANKRLRACPLPISSSVATTEKYSLRIDAAAGSEKFVRTTGKDWVVHPRITSRVAVNYGMHDDLAPYWNEARTWRVWQPEGGTHSPEHQDYSQLLTAYSRLVQLADGTWMDVEDILTSHDPAVWKLLSYSKPGIVRYVPLHSYEGIHVSGKQPWTDGLNLPEVVLKFARDSVGIHESAPNRGPWVDRVILACGLQPPQYWCAAAASEWLYQACAAKGIAAPIPRIAGALRFGTEILKKGVGWSPNMGQSPAFDASVVPGAFFVRKRPEGPPGSGHIGVLEERLYGGTKWSTIESNVNDAVVRSCIDLLDSRLVCVGHFGWGERNELAYEIAARQLALSIALRDGLTNEVE